MRRNALKHGLTGETLVALGEDAEAFRLMADAHLAVFRPRNDVELEFANTFTLAAWRRRRCVSTETAMVNQYIRDTQLAAEVIAQQDVLALGDRLFHDSQGYWQLYPDPSLKDCPISQRTNEVPGGRDLPARLVNELESSYQGCRLLLDRWNDLKVRTQKGNFWQSFDKFKAIRLLGKQPLDVLEDTGELLVIFLASHALYPENKSPFSELRCEVAADQYPTVRQRLELLAVEMERDMPPGDAAAGQVLNDLIARQTRRLEQLALKHKARADAEAAERTRRLAFDPSEEADKVRRYEDASIRRITRACDDLAKLRRSGMFDQDAQEPEPPDAVRGREQRPARELLDDIAVLHRYEQPGSGEAGESSAQAEETGCDAPPPMSETTLHDPPPTEHGDPPASGENTDIESDAPPEEFRSPAAAQPPGTTVHRPRPTLDGNTGPWNALLLVVCFWWFVGSDHWAALRGSQSSPSFRELALGSSPVASSLGPLGPAATETRIEPTAARTTGEPRSDHEHRTMNNERVSQNEATAVCAGRAGSADRLTVTAPSETTGGEGDQAVEQRPRHSEPAARNKAKAIGSDSAEYSGEVGSALTRQTGNSAMLILDPSTCAQALLAVPRGRGSPERLTTKH